MELVEYLDWDSNFFGISIGRASIDNNQLRPEILDQAVEEARASDIKCLYIEIPFSTPDVREYCSNNRFLLVDLKTTLGKKLDKKDSRSNSAHITYELEDRYYPFLLTIVKQISLQSRYTYDLNFGSEVSFKLYEEWLRKAYYENRCHDVILYLNDDKPAGFITVKIKDEHPCIDLLGVSSEQRRNKIGTCLIEDAERKLSIAGYDRLNVVTQGHNIGALRTYQSLDFKIESITVYYHKWID